MPSAPAQCHRPIAAIAPPCHIPLRVPSSNRSPLRPQSNTRKYAIYCRALQAPSSSRLSPPSKRRSKRSVPLAGRAAPPPSAAPVARAAARNTSTCTAPPPARSSQVSAGGQRPGTGVLGGANALTEPFSAWAQPRRVCWGRGTFDTHVAGLAVLQALHSPLVPQAALTGPLCAGRTPMVWTFPVPRKNCRVPLHPTTRRLVGAALPRPLCAGPRAGSQAWRLLLATKRSEVGRDSVAAGWHAAGFGAAAPLLTCTVSPRCLWLCAKFHTHCALQKHACKFIQSCALLLSPKQAGGAGQPTGRQGQALWPAGRPGRRQPPRGRRPAGQPGRQHQPAGRWRQRAGGQQAGRAGAAAGAAQQAHSRQARQVRWEPVRCVRSHFIGAWQRELRCCTAEQQPCAPVLGPPNAGMTKTTSPRRGRKRCWLAPAATPALSEFF